MANTDQEEHVEPPGGPPDNRRFPVVGVAASAGGLDAFKSLLTALPADSGMAFILVPHLDPSRASMMVELLRPYSSMPIQEVREKTRVVPNAVYVIPPNRNLEIKARTLHLYPLPEGLAYHTSIDPFFRSLAEDLRELAVGIVLSGTGSHGTLGLQAIKAHGGLTLAQEPTEAEYDQMPQSALAAGVADHVLPVAQMPEALTNYRSHPYASARDTSTPLSKGDFLSRVLALLKARTKYNFGSYRKNMLLRRIQRRMGLNHVEAPDAYIQSLRDDPEELKLLFQDLLIGVSGFFRDTGAFDLLAQRVLPDLIGRRAKGDIPIRVWVPGCATGEEAYSIAMLFYEAMDRANKNVPFQIFATDINEEALKVARAGVYPDSVSVDISSERLRRFFTRMDHHYQVKKHLREPVMFALQNVVSDTPFSRLDLISCRNLLIYLEPEAQQKVLTLFHFALNEAGYLLLGTSETVGRHTDLYEPVSKKWRVFRRIGPVRPEKLEFPLGNKHALLGPYITKREGAVQPAKIGALAEELLIDTFVPACALINRKFEVLYLSGPTRKYLSLPPGEPTHDLLAMVQDGLRARVRNLCYQAGKTHARELYGDTHVKRNGEFVHVRVGVKDVDQPKALEGLWLVTFEEIDDTAPASASTSADNNDRDALVPQLEAELKATREDLQTTIEELESSNEELKSSNEEMMSMNEELQSVNEEMETSKEELQSLNEELNTVNNQLEEKVEELDKTNNDLTNLLNSADITTLFLDTNMRVRRFTPSTVKLLNLMPSDVGRSISDFSYKFNDNALLTDAHAVLDKLVPRDKHVWSNDGLCYLRRITPYRTANNQIEGVVVTFIDITPQVMADVELKRMATVLEKTEVAIVTTDPDGHIIAWNQGAEKMYGYSQTEALSMDAADLAPRDHRDETRSLLARAAGGGEIEAFETRRVTKGGRTMNVVLSGTRITGTDGRVTGVIFTELDITERKRLQQELLSMNKDLKQRISLKTAEAEEKTLQLSQREQFLSAIVNTDPNGIITVNEAGLITRFNPAAERMFGYQADMAIGKDAAMLLANPPRDGDGGRWVREFSQAGPARLSPLPELLGLRRDGAAFPVELSISMIDHLNTYLLVTRDMSRQRALEKEVIDVSTQEQERIGHEIHDGLGQQLTALTMMATGLQKRLSGLSGRDAELMENLLHQLRNASDEASKLSRGLAPVPIDPGGLRLALKQMADRVSASAGISCRLEGKRTVQLADRIQALQLFRICQEAVNNAVKHAQARNITIELAAENGGIRLKISDDGTGFNTRSKKAVEGLGMHIMHYRANIIGAGLTVDSQKGKGTAVLCILPGSPAGPGHARK